jgi:hypothetical protein
MKKINQYYLLLSLLFIFLCNGLNANSLVYFKANFKEALLIQGSEKNYSAVWNDSLFIDESEYNNQFLSSILTNIGLKIELNELSSLMFLYELNYEGPGIKGFSSQGFSSRNMDHAFLAKYFYSLDKDSRLSIKTDFFYEFYRLGKTEDWDNGLYNFGKVGGGIGYDRFFSDKNLGAVTLDAHYFWFPNYEDLTREAFYMLNSTSSLNEDAVNQNFIQLTFTLSDQWTLSDDIKLNFSYLFFWRNYTGIRIDLSEAILDNTNNPFQRDFAHEFKASATFALSSTMFLEPQLRLIYLTSNYNYFYVLGIDVSGLNYIFVPEYMTNTEYELSLSYSIQFSQNVGINFTPAFQYKNYPKRYPQDENGQFMKDKTQKHIALTLPVAFSIQPYNNFTITPQYVFKTAKSNNKELTAGYNYQIHYFGVDMTFEF